MTFHSSRATLAPWDERFDRRPVTFDRPEVSRYTIPNHRLLRISSLVFELSVQLEDISSETGVLLLKLQEAAQGLIIGGAHYCLEPHDGSLELGEGGVRAGVNGEIKRSNDVGCTCST